MKYGVSKQGKQRRHSAMRMLLFPHSSPTTVLTSLCESVGSCGLTCHQDVLHPQPLSQPAASEDWKCNCSSRGHSVGLGDSAIVPLADTRQATVRLSALLGPHPHGFLSTNLHSKWTSAPVYLSDNEHLLNLDTYTGQNSA